jgi:hypothetical protein
MIPWPIAILAYLVGFFCGMAVVALIVLKEKK